MRWSPALRAGRYQEALHDVTDVDLLLADTPYSERTHRSHARVNERRADRSRRRSIPYRHWTKADLEEFGAFWAPRTRGWWVIMTDHELVREWAAVMEATGRYVFAPLPFVDRGRGVRMQGDGPSSWTVWIVVGRPRFAPFTTWGTLPGEYRRELGDPRGGHMGGKPRGVMRALVRDYSRPGNTVVDPTAGEGTTLGAAFLEGRIPIGAEEDGPTRARGLRVLERLTARGRCRP